MEYPDRVAIDDDPSLADGELLGMLRSMLEIRGLEDEIQRAFTKDLVRGSTHLCNGQEAGVVGACTALAEQDTMVCTYRGHGAVLAMGAPLDATFAEIVGRETGLCGGKGGSMHLTDVRVGAYGSFAIVGAHLPIANGLALGARQRGRDSVSLCFFGDGSTNIGAFHESLNLAAVWSLPVIFFCENNLYGEYTPWRATTRVERLADRAASYGMPGVRVDGNDVVAVHQVTAEAVARARSGAGPTLIESVTYRHRGHSRTDPATYRPEGELDRWLEVDPVLRLRALLTTRGIGEDRIAGTEAAAKESVRTAVESALAAPPPRPDALFKDVYA
ncbi:thiamine pyrophosphate-dependent dehydrogenase E1 component subunit alpha [Nocardioides sp. AE5]|uniref:thiamine pyrophosphate-dependent dehydrogenase E1 component subunit alpha n=1 Tax=Nocardioides sp. AE5 TaxID=2962573 RepID=UPI002881C268|nr:thiamine pyrophosphate-dependent dehydrogenase E1 component subunit alpha [Nocardioides sp. AE5]MDT0203160.1 thiamine pyrophosphate-dependent dehydrogenase E1 component subunit alpha [Nocardioides sp. AE5]